MTIKEHLDHTVKLWRAIITEWEEMDTLLQYEKASEPLYRRFIIRNIFSVLESYLYVTKELIKIKIIIDNDEVSWAELALLHEKRVILDKQGNIQVNDDFQETGRSLRFTLNIFANVFNDVKPTYEDSNFEKLEKLIQRRNAISHPKSLQELTITNEELKDVQSIRSWLMQIHHQLHQKFTDWYNAAGKSQE